jgi:uncharacterized protein YdhG (YjbR/CyaY superfamily)
MPGAKTTTTRSRTSGTPADVWSDAERAAAREATRERRAAARRSPEDERAEGERDLLAKIADMPEPDRAMAGRVHAIVTANAPSLVPRTYYGMPAYARDGKTICFFKPRSKFKERYATLGFEQHASLDDGSMWPTSYALTELTAANEERIAELVKQAAS